MTHFGSFTSQTTIDFAVIALNIALPTQKQMSQLASIAQEWLVWVAED